jgi:hypothetical protein
MWTKVIPLKLFVRRNVCFVRYMYRLFIVRIRCETETTHVPLTAYRSTVRKDCCEQAIGYLNNLPQCNSAGYILKV